MSGCHTDTLVAALRMQKAAHAIAMDLHRVHASSAEGADGDTFGIALAMSSVALEIAERILALKVAPIADPVPCVHEWGIDGQHTNEYCKKCFVSKPSVEEQPK